MARKHYVRVYFGIAKDNSPEIYDFLFKHLPDVLKEMKIDEVSIEIERLEPIDMIYSNLEKPKEEVMKILDGFAKSHHLIEEPSLTYTQKKTSLKAKVKTAKLGGLLSDYNILFDIFFTDLIIKAKGFMIDMMDGFNNTLLAAGEKDAIEKFQKAVKKRLRKTRFVEAD
jgi:ethanolamine utilization microcompartment shell protein EutS